MPRKSTKKVAAASKSVGFEITNLAAPEAKPEPAPPAPAPIPPAVLALQEDIVSLVRGRAEYQKQVGIAQEQAFAAQAQLQAAQGRLQAIDQEVQYRMSVIAQMQGKPSEPQMPFIVHQGQTQAAISSVPSRPPAQQPGYDNGDNVLRAHATRDVL